MAAGLVSHNITSASGFTFAVVSWVPNTAAPDVGAVPIARITDGTNVAPVDATNGLAVQIIPALPAGTNAIGKLAANSGVDIGDVDVTTVGTITPGTAATSLGKAEDAGHSSGDVGVMALAVRNDAGTVLAGTDADYVPLTTDSSGNLRTVLSSTQVASVLDCSTTVTRPADTNAYTANDAFANSTSAPTAGGFTFTSAAAVSGGGGIITDAVIVASAATLYQGEVWIFDSAATAVNDNAAFACSDADCLLLIGKIPFTLVADVSTTSLAHVSGLNIGFHCVGTANLRFLVRILNAPTPGNGETLTVRIKGIRS